ncbi:hypothetical protein BSP11_024 [Bacillus phage BSP11]|nr:hypothetical protein BSP11_024 [Bacillus phage BSP11]
MIKLTPVLTRMLLNSVYGKITALENTSPESQKCLFEYIKMDVENTERFIKNTEDTQMTNSTMKPSKEILEKTIAAINKAIDEWNNREKEDNKDEHKQS